MPTRIVIVGMEEVLSKMRVLGDEMPAALGRALYRFAEVNIVRPAKQEYVPVVTGALRSSIRVEEPFVTRRSASVVVAAGGAAAKYGLRVHENPRSGQTGGRSPSGKKYKRWSRVGSWKFLEVPAFLAASNNAGLAREAGNELEAVIRGLH